MKTAGLALIIGILTISLAWLIRREYLALRRFARAIAYRVIRLLDQLEKSAFSDYNPSFVARPTEEEYEPVGDYPTPLEAFHDEVLAKLEEQRRATRGASTAEVCTHWAEQDEREAAEEQVRLARTKKRLGVN